MTDEKETQDQPAEEQNAPATEEKTEEAPVQEQEAPAEEAEEVEVPQEFQKIVEQIESMTVLELNELVKVFEKKFGVSAAAVAAPAGGGDAGAEEQDSFTVELTSFGEQKVAVIKVIKEVTGLGLKEAKDLVEGAPQVVKEGLKKEESDELKAKLEEAGATVTLK